MINEYYTYGKKSFQGEETPNAKDLTVLFPVVNEQAGEEGLTSSFFFRFVVRCPIVGVRVGRLHVTRTQIPAKQAFPSARSIVHPIMSKRESGIID